jgi:hypothetical protein
MAAGSLPKRNSYEGTKTMTNGNNNRTSGKFPFLTRVHIDEREEARKNGKKETGKEGRHNSFRSLPSCRPLLSPLSGFVPVSVPVLPSFRFRFRSFLPAYSRPFRRPFRFRPLAAQERTGTNSRQQGTKRGHGAFLERFRTVKAGRGGEGGRPHFVH